MSHWNSTQEANLAVNLVTDGNCSFPFARNNHHLVLISPTLRSPKFLSLPDCDIKDKNSGHSKTPVCIKSALSEKKNTNPSNVLFGDIASTRGLWIRCKWKLTHLLKVRWTNKHQTFMLFSFDSWCVFLSLTMLTNWFLPANSCLVSLRKLQSHPCKKKTNP